MVFFTCDACGDSLKKNQVEKHYLYKCRRCTMVTCVDCHKDFPGDAYKEHTRCITEAEKYSGKGWQPKASANKGAKKQAAWMERLHKLVDDKATNMDSDVGAVLNAIMNYDNIPRKRVKFVNFCKNVMSRRCSPSTIDKTWDVFEQALKEPTAAKEKENNNANRPEPVKRKREDEDEDGGEEKRPRVEGEGDRLKFDWIGCMATLVEKKGQIKAKKLKKKVVNEFVERNPATVKTRLQLEAKFEKKLAKSKKFKIANETVRLATSRD